MWLLYDLTIFLYGLAIRLAAWFNPKARLWVSGRHGHPAESSQHSFINQRSAISDRKSSLAWFHCASLGEFEQGRPVIEEFRKNHPGWKILLTFFSPSGYEIRKDYDGADLVMYLPLDTARNARNFIGSFHPDIAVFVKYEFWYRYIDRLHIEDIPIYLASGIFRPQQHFFRWYGGWARRQLKKFTHFFVQDEKSEQLLHEIGIDTVTVSGDTRFDRVAAIADHAKGYPLVEEFARNKKVVLAGSTWPADEELLFGLMERFGDDVKFIIAPHEVSSQRIEALYKQVVSRQSSIVSHHAEVRSKNSENSLRENDSKLKTQNSKFVLLFSQMSPENASGARVLIVDGMGYLSGLYQYATVAYIGGGFGVGIHNILEAATFGKPVIFGPNYGKFREAVELAERNAAFPVSNEQELSDICSNLMTDDQVYLNTSKKCRDYVINNQGATKVILEGIEKDITAH